ncbi:hypothetical protein ACIREO_36235 [Streptomyces sp. NPDC102441]|uniref:hypothetical protein n=1 Tax=Streptomyces sp. NPDC102441 TaxID=3366176 RepID=UPI0037F5345C
MPSSDSTGREGRDPDAEIVAPGDGGPDEGPSDVFLDVPALHVDKLDLEVDDLEAHVSLKAEVLDLLKLNVGADVRLGRVQLGIEGVDVQAQLKVRLHHIAAIVTRLLATVDRNPQILEQLTRGVGAAVEDVGAGTGRAAGELGEGAGAAVSEVGRGAGSAVESVGAGTGTAVEDVGSGAGSAVDDVGRSAADAVEEVGEEGLEGGQEEKAEEGSGRPAARRRRRAPERSAEPDKPRRKAPAKKATRAAERKAAPAEKPTAKNPTAKKAVAKKSSAAKTVTKRAAGRPRHRT